MLTGPLHELVRKSNELQASLELVEEDIADAIEGYPANKRIPTIDNVGDILRDVISDRLAQVEIGRGLSSRNQELTRENNKLHDEVDRLTSCVAELETALGYAKSVIGQDGADQVPSMLRAIEAGIVSQLHPTEHRKRQEYLRRRRWIMESETSWKNLDTGKFAPYEVAAKMQIEDDLRPFKNVE